MSTNQDRQEVDLRDEATVTSARSSESATDLADSPTVNDPDAALSPATRARADLPAQPGPGMMMDTLHHPLQPRNQDGEAVMTRRSPNVDPGAPFDPGLGATVDDTAGGGRLDQADIGDRLPGAEQAQFADHGGGVPGHAGTEVALDETTGTDDPSARTGRGGRGA